MSELQRIINEPIDITERVKSYEDACQILNKKPKSSEQFNFFDEGERQVAFATHKLQIIIKALNEGWTPNWSNTNEKKWYPWFKMNDSNASGGVSFANTCYNDWHTYSYVGSRFCLKNEKLARYVGVTFIDLYREMMVI
jgi:hypothetical protein